MTDIDALLRRCDAEPDAGLTPAEADHREWLLAQITSILPARGTAARRGAPGKPGRPRLALGIASAVAGAAAIAATGLAVAVLTPGQSSSPPPGARLAAWTVTTGANGTVDVTIRQLTDAEGLQRALRADGIPARVLFGQVVLGPQEPNGDPVITGGGPRDPAADPRGWWQEVDPSETLLTLPPGCKAAGPVPALESADALTKIIGTPLDWFREGVALTLHPASIPPGVGLYLAVDFESSRTDWTWSVYPVKASPACTGT
jgi:hypothetical protein